MSAWTGIETGMSMTGALSRALITVGDLLGQGGQGQVWRVSGPDGQQLALKWYFPASATDDQRQALIDLVRRGAPDPRFLWPLDYVEGSSEVPGFGYLMELRSLDYHPMAALMQRSIDPSFTVLTTAAADMADAFLALHAQGLCYLDISFGNVYLNPTTGGILICDNDNVRIDGRPAGIAGTARFMAPEVIRALAAGQMPTPNRSTDLFSLAVLLFYMFVMHHPYEGAREAAIECLGIEAQNRLYGEDPVFIFDPDDESNRPHPELHPNPLLLWPLYPEYIRGLFTRAFTTGTNQPGERVQESEWRRAMTALRDAIRTCPDCGAECFQDGTTVPTCWNCGVALSAVPVLAGSGGAVPLDLGRSLYPHHTTGRSYDFTQPTASVVLHPDRPDVWGLQNHSDQPWTIADADGSRHTVGAGQTARLADGVTIDFGAATAGIVGDPPGSPE